MIRVHPSGIAACSVPSWRGMLGAPFWIERDNKFVIAGFNVGIPAVPLIYELEYLYTNGGQIGY